MEKVPEEVLSIMKLLVEDKNKKERELQKAMQALETFLTMYEENAGFGELAGKGAYIYDLDTGAVRKSSLHPDNAQAEKPKLADESDESDESSPRRTSRKK